MNRPAHRVLASGFAPALALALLGACASTDPYAPRSEVDRLVRKGEYVRAVELARERVDAKPGDPALREQWRLASIALLLDQGRQLSFADRDDEALAKFLAACELGPEVRQAIEWRESQLDKLADLWVTQAIEWHNKDELSKASERYEKALTYRPDDSRAKNGLGRVLVQLNYRRGMGEKYYKGGLEALADYWLDQASHHFSATGKYDSENERATRRRAQADTLRADDRVLQAADFEEQGQFGAARNEYRFATLFDPEHKAALEGLERTKKEEQAAEFLRECERSILRRKFEDAAASLDKGVAMTARQGDAFAAARERLHEARLQVDYEVARALEVDYQYEAASAAYAAIVSASHQGFFKDAIARRDTLEDLIQKAASLYERAQTEADSAAKMKLLEQVQLVYPEYRDTQAQLRALRAPSPAAPAAAETGDTRD
jgi:tetratricopeptide (TPR) repeat protein